MSQDQGENFIIDRNQFPKLFETLRSQGYQIIGPTVREQVIVYEEINGVEDLPIGKTDEQSPGSYRLANREDKALFGYTVGPQSPKNFLFPKKLKLFEAQKEGRTFRITSGFNPDSTDLPKLAFVGIKPCEISAIAVQDKVFLEGIYTDPLYQSLRERSVIIAVNCTSPGSHCFCASMKTGPRASQGFDLALTEIIEGNEHYFLVDVGSEKGSTLLESIPNRPAESSHQQVGQRVFEKAVHTMGKVMESTDIRNLLFENLEHREWDAVAARCLACTNCTLVCPTCFCTTVWDETDLSGEHTEHWRRWNSCFTLDFTKVAGGNFRISTKSRYRQWLTHKLAGWYDQFGISGCVGCGRCITWCPVGIDIVAEVDAIRGNGISQ
jgi:sulfhydrogenase subunit beta (sulfur reductase)